MNTRDTFDLFTEPDAVRGRFGEYQFRRDDEPLRVCLHNQTDKAILVSLNGDARQVVWIPKFKKDGTPLIQIELSGKRERENGGLGTYEIADLRIPEWLAKEKGLI